MIFGLTMMLLAVAGFEPLIGCPAQKDRPSVVRRLDRGSFIASTPCGLYLIFLHGGVKRLPHPPNPGALDADGRGRAVVASGKELWLLEPEGKRRLEYTLAEAPGKLEILGDWLLVEGKHRWLLGLYEFHQEKLSDWSLHSVSGRDRLLPVVWALPEEPSRFSRWLPEVKLSVFGGQTRKIRWHQEGAWDFTAGNYAGVFVTLTWHLDRMEDSGEELRARIERDRMRSRERSAVLRAAFREHCKRNDQQALAEIRALIDLLTSGAVR